MKNTVFSLLILVLLASVSCNKYDAKGNLIKEYNELAKIKKLMEPTDSFFIDIKEALSMYLNKRYEEEFEGHPIIINHI